MKNKKCMGCGAKLQTLNPNIPGYIDNTSDTNKICKRCFRIKNYGERISININNEEYKKIFERH